jgi:predicted dithiol-disulfide oxidoreductase (DUF899 family)
MRSGIEESIMTQSAMPEVVSRDAWERARAKPLIREKEHTRAGDQLAAERRRMPMTRMDPAMVVGKSGPIPLPDVFEGRRMLIVYHFMWKEGAPHPNQCEGCTHSQVAMNDQVCAYLAARDVTHAVSSVGRLDEILAYRDFMGWTMPWYSTAHSGPAFKTRNGGDLACRTRANIAGRAAQSEAQNPE